MFSSMNESVMRNTHKTDPMPLIHDRYFDLQKSEQVKIARPVEDSRAGNKAKNHQDKEETDTRYLIDDKQVIFEKYNKDGDLILRLPPSYAPVDELA